MGNHHSADALAAGGGGAAAPRDEPLECVIREHQRDEHLKNLGFKRSKSIRKSIAKKLRKKDKRRDELDNGGDSTPRLEPKGGDERRWQQPAAAAAVQVETRTSIGSKVEGGKKVEVIKVEEKKSAGPLVGQPQPLPAHIENDPPKRMDRLRRSIRHSMRKRKEINSGLIELSKTQKWQIDEAAVRSSTCTFYVKYLGCCEVFESRGMQVCEAAVRTLKEQRRRTIRGTLYVSGDSLRVVDDDTKGLVLDQTIEKVSFCAPDRNYEKGFSYICRDGTTRRWMCHGFMAVGESGERLSHAVGCAFGICLENKQRRDKIGVSMNYDAKESSFTRVGSFRQGTMTERLADPQALKPAAGPPPVSPKEAAKPDDTTCAVERPRPTEMMYQRQASFRGLGQISGQSPFKRGSKGHMSLRLNELPSNKERRLSSSGGSLCESPILEDLELPPSKLEEASNLSILCQQVSTGLDLLTGPADPFTTQAELAATSAAASGTSTPPPETLSAVSISPPPPTAAAASGLLQPVRLMSQLPETPPESNCSSDNPWDHVPDQPTSPVHLANGTAAAGGGQTGATGFSSVASFPSPSLSQPGSLASAEGSSVAGHPHPSGDQWLNSVVISTGGVKSGSVMYGVLPPASADGGGGGLLTNGLRLNGGSANRMSSGFNSPASTSTASDVAAGGDVWSHQQQQQQQVNSIQDSIMEDPFDAEWADIATRKSSVLSVDSVAGSEHGVSTNPFIQAENTVKAFELQL